MQVSEIRVHSLCSQGMWSGCSWHFLAKKLTYLRCCLDAVFLALEFLRGVGRSPCCPKPKTKNEQGAGQALQDEAIEAEQSKCKTSIEKTTHAWARLCFGEQRLKSTNPGPGVRAFGQMPAQRDSLEVADMRSMRLTKSAVNISSATGPFGVDAVRYASRIMQVRQQARTCSHLCSDAQLPNSWGFRALSVCLCLSGALGLLRQTFTVCLWKLHCGLTVQVHYGIEGRDAHIVLYQWLQHIRHGRSALQNLQQAEPCRIQPEAMFGWVSTQLPA